MRVGNLAGRAVLVRDGRAVDVERASGGRFGPDPQGLYADWDAFRAWAGSDEHDGEPFDPADLGAPVPAPRQIFAIGLNYREHAAESGLDAPDTAPPVFTKFVSSLTGPVTDVTLPPGGHTDWEVELVAVIGTTARNVPEADGWAHVAGLTVGQDISERVSQLAGPAPQFSLGKSFPGFAPTGPWVVTPEEFPHRDDLELGSAINGEEVQKGRTRDLIFSVPVLVARLSAVLPLLPGDLIFTGTPPGVGLGRTPQRWLRPGDELVSHVASIGELRQRFVAG